jgi:putative tryptophan/tyrosine transport system ATP-binding protein
MFNPFRRQEPITPDSNGQGYRVVLDDVSFRPANFNGYVLKDINLVIEPGQFVAIVGPNGAGKSSVLRAIAGEIQDFEGTITVGGQSVAEPINRVIDGVGIVHQNDDADLIGHLSVADNISIRQLLGGGHTGGFFANSPAWRRNVASILGSHPAAGTFRLEKIVRNLSGGMRQMLSVTIAVHLEHRLNPCRLLLLDEHTSRLDHVNSRGVMDYTAAQIANSRATTVMVTHRYSDALRYSQRIVIVREGKMSGDFLVSEIKSIEHLASLVEAEEP